MFMILDSLSQFSNESWSGTSEGSRQFDSWTDYSRFKISTNGWETRILTVNGILRAWIYFAIIKTYQHAYVWSIYKWKSFTCQQTPVQCLLTLPYHWYMDEQFYRSLYFTYLPYPYFRMGICWLCTCYKVISWSPHGRKHLLYNKRGTGRLWNIADSTISSMIKDQIWGGPLTCYKWKRDGLEWTAHILQLCISDGFKNNAPINRALVAAWKLVGHFYPSTLATAKPFTISDEHESAKT